MYSLLGIAIASTELTANAITYNRLLIASLVFYIRTFNLQSGKIFF